MARGITIKMAENFSTDPPTSDLRRQIVGGGMVLVIVQVLMIGLRLAGMIFITTLLGPARFGPYIAAFGIFSFVLGVGQSGIGVFLMRQPGKLDPLQVGTATTLLLALSIAIVSIVELAAAPIADYVRLPEFLPVLRLMMLALPLQTLSIPALTRIRRDMDVKGMAVIELIGQVAFYAAAVPLIFNGHGAVALAGCVVLQYAVMIILAYARSGERPVVRWDREIALRLCRYTFSFSIANYIWQARSLVNPLIVAPVLGSTAVGVLGLAVVILEILTIPRGMIWLVSVAAMARVQEDLARMRRIITEGMELQVLLIGAILLGFGWLGEGLMRPAFGAYGDQLFALYPYIALLYLTGAMFNMHTAVLSVLDKNWWLVLYQGVHIAVFFTAAAIWVPRVGQIGYGYAEIIAIATYALLHILVARLTGAPDYRLALIWWTGAAVGLFWRQISVYAIAIPFAVLFVPASQQRLKKITTDILSRQTVGRLD